MVNVNKISKNEYLRRISKIMNPNNKKLSNIWQTLSNMEFEMNENQNSENEYFNMTKKGETIELEIKPNAYRNNLKIFSEGHIERFKEMNFLIKKFEYAKFETSISDEKIIVYDFSINQRYHLYVSLLLNPVI